MKSNFIGLVLAAGKGTRFKSNKIKVLHSIMGKPMLGYVLDCLKKLKLEETYVVVGNQKEKLMEEFSSEGINFVEQKEQLGTAHAVMSADKILKKNLDKDILIINGDIPLIRPETIRSFFSEHRKKNNSLTFFSAELDNPYGFGRVIHKKNKGISIIEEKDASGEQRKIKNVNAGIYMFKVKDLKEALPKVSDKNVKKEYYITDLIEIMGQMQKKVGVFKTDHPEEVIGVNDRNDLSKVTDIIRKKKIKTLAKKGITIYDPGNTWIDVNVKIGRDTVIYPSVIIEGNSIIGSNCLIYPFVHIIDSRIGNYVRVLSSTYVENSVLNDEVRLGPFSRLRPNTVIKRGAKIGNFVEMKNTIFGKKSKAGHLSYLGDCEVKEDVNIGAGTITCNYDGVRKHKTVIERNAFIGSGVELVAPVKIGKGAYIGAGSTITKDVKPESLAISRIQQKEKENWTRKKQKRVKSRKE
ncbi:MAG: bifunctional UDP-N-acetylglucosamine diphosphorylase/glucosamine-1-phosphate N-acetyltransferase GlmU [Candidatus Aminicenantaceae bacterium]